MQEKAVSVEVSFGLSFYVYRSSWHDPSEYKVVDSELGSCLASGRFYVHYRPGEFVAAPKGTKFFVFESLEHANELRNSDYSWQTWKATARGLYLPRREW